MSGFNSKKFYGPDEPEQESSNKQGKNHITINFTFNIGNTDFHFEQRAEGGGQINHDVGTNANQGGQNASNGSHTRNVNSQFADGNGRSGIAVIIMTRLVGNKALKYGIVLSLKVIFIHPLTIVKVMKKLMY